MKRKPFYWLLSCLMMIGLFPAGASAQTEPESVIYGGGPFYSGGTQTMDILKQSGFTTVMLWTIHVHGNGDLYYNDQLVVSNGAYVGDSAW